MRRQKERAIKSFRLANPDEWERWMHLWLIAKATCERHRSAREQSMSDEPETQEEMTARVVSPEELNYLERVDELMSSLQSTEVFEVVIATSDQLAQTSKGIEVLQDVMTQALQKQPITNEGIATLWQLVNTTLDVISDSLPAYMMYMETVRRSQDG